MYNIITGAVSRKDQGRMDKHAALFYDEVRKRRGDEYKIAQNTGFTVKDIELIKSHMFFNEYDLGDPEGKLERFTPDYDQAVSWQRLVDGRNIQEMDLVLLNHELMELKLMYEQGLSYVEAHCLANKKYDYSMYVRELNLKEGIK